MRAHARPGTIGSGPKKEPEEAILIVIAVVSLLGAASLLVPRDALLAPVLLGAALLALTGGLGGLEDRSVRQHDPPMNPKGWRDDS
jgi:hypothetical protein